MACLNSRVGIAIAGDMGNGRGIGGFILFECEIYKGSKVRSKYFTNTIHILFTPLKTI